MGSELQIIFFSRRTVRHLLSLILAVLFLETLATFSMAQNISASLSQEERNSVVLHIVVQHRAPLSLIAQIFIPSSHKVLATKPAAAKIDRKEGFVKWLIKNEEQSAVSLYVATDKPLDLGSTTARVRYRKASDGSIMDIWAEKK